MHWSPLIPLKGTLGALTLSLGLGAVAVGATACGEAERTFDCIDICGKYEECVDDDLDETSCIDQCEDQGDADPSFEQAASDCEECLDGRACAESAPCAPTCGPVVAGSI